MITRRNMALQVLWMILTLGLYSLYWFYMTSREMLDYKGLQGSPLLWLILLFIPFANLYSYWQHGRCVEALTDGKYNVLLMFLAWIVFSPIVWFITQMELNNRAG